MDYDQFIKPTFCSIYLDISSSIASAITNKVNNKIWTLNNIGVTSYTASRTIYWKQSFMREIHFNYFYATIIDISGQIRVLPKHSNKTYTKLTHYFYSLAKSSIYQLFSAKIFSGNYLPKSFIQTKVLRYTVSQ